MTPNELRRIFPGASASTIARNLDLGQLRPRVDEQIKGPLVGPQPTKKARAKSVARSGPTLRIAIVGFSHRIKDDDNFTGGTKPLRDSIAEWLGMSDSQKNIQWNYSQCQTSGAEGVVVKIEKI